MIVFPLGHMCSTILSLFRERESWVHSIVAQGAAVCIFVCLSSTDIVLIIGKVWTIILSRISQSTIFAKFCWNSLVSRKNREVFIFCLGYTSLKTTGARAPCHPLNSTLQLNVSINPHGYFQQEEACCWNILTLMRAAGYNEWRNCEKKSTARCDLFFGSEGGLTGITCCSCDRRFTALGLFAKRLEQYIAFIKVTVSVGTIEILRIKNWRAIGQRHRSVWPTLHGH